MKDILLLMVFVESLLTSSGSELFFLANWGKNSPSSAEAQPPQQESLTPIRQTLLLYEGRLHPATNAVQTNATILRQAW
jgi:hypothetical protein